MIERPKRYPTFPEYLYNSSVAKPTFYWKKDEVSGGEVFEIIWLNLIKICRMRVNEDGKYKMEVIKNIDLENVYICGMT